MVTPAYKNRRSEMKIKRHMKSSTLERREGVTYQTGDDVTEFPSQPIEEIPSPPIPVLQLPLPSDDYT